MAIVLSYKEGKSPADFFTLSVDIAKAYELKDTFRRLIGDDDSLKNVFEDNDFSFKDSQIYGFLRDAIDDINSGIPQTAYNIGLIGDDMFVVKGAIVMALTARGILESKNSLNFSDQGISINTYDKAPSYQSWAGTISNDYLQMKLRYKQAEYYRNMFTGIHSDYNRMSSHNID